VLALARPGDRDAAIAFVFTSLCGSGPRPGELAALRELAATEPDPGRGMFLVASTVMASDAAVVLR
jgi:hypothetical protein